jgi:hypothetical protein
VNCPVLEGTLVHFTISAPSTNPIILRSGSSPQCIKMHRNDTYTASHPQFSSIIDSDPSHFFSAHGSRTDLFPNRKEHRGHRPNLQCGPDRGQKLSPSSSSDHLSHNPPKSIASASRSPTFSQAFQPTKQAVISKSSRRPSHFPSRALGRHPSDSAHPSRSPAPMRTAPQPTLSTQLMRPTHPHSHPDQSQSHRRVRFVALPPTSNG